MKASVQYNDLVGTVAADITDFLGGPGKDNLKAVAKHFGLDEERFELIGLSLYGTSMQFVSLICIDRERSSTEKNYVVSMSVDSEKAENILNTLFKRIHILFQDKFGGKLDLIDRDEETSFSDYHK